MSGALVSANFFSALGTQPLLGRVIGAADDQPGGENHVAVLSYALWQSHFGGDREILSKTTEVNGQRFSIIGVMPADFDFPNRSEMWCPLVPGGGLHDNRASRLLTVIANLGGGKSLAAARAESSAIAAQIENENPGMMPGLAITPVPLKESVVAPVRPALLIMVIAAGPAFTDCLRQRREFASGARRNPQKRNRHAARIGRWPRASCIANFSRKA